MLQTFSPLVSPVDMVLKLQPVEFLLDKELAFEDYKPLKPFQVRMTKTKAKKVPLVNLICEFRSCADEGCTELAAGAFE